QRQRLLERGEHLQGHFQFAQASPEQRPPMATTGDAASAGGGAPPGTSAASP
ncbi:unnamed protein product, partial [Amoebophrya sp. A120]